MYLFQALRVPAYSATVDSISAGEALVGDAKLVSSNGRYALGFYNPGSKSGQTPKSWESPVVGPHGMSKLAISRDGNLAIFNKATKSMVWSSRASITAKNTTAVLLDNGNLVLRDVSNSSTVLWQSFDYPTDIMPPGAKFGLDKITGLNRRLVSKRSLIDPSPGRYCLELDPSGVAQFVFKLCNTSIVYWSWSTLQWDEQYFNLLLPELPEHDLFEKKFINNDKEEYFQYNMLDENTILVSRLDISGRNELLLWDEDADDWLAVYVQPKDQCDVYATLRSPNEWEQRDRAGGCLRNTPLDCSTMNKSITATTDKFYSLPGVSLPAEANIIASIDSADQCAQACLNNCLCTAYSYSSGNRCSLWYKDLLNTRRYTDGITSTGEILYLRIAAKDAESWTNNKRKGMIVGVVTAACLVGLAVMAAFLTWFLVMWRNKMKQSLSISDDAQGGNGIVAFRYIDLQKATKNFSERIGGGGFGSVFRGLLTDSTAIAVKRLDGVRQGEKQIRAEVSSIGIIQHINLVKLIGFCSERDMRLLVYEHMPNHSLDAHLFHSHSMVLNWSTRYQIALGVARGLAYLHESCRDCIIHCDIKPENILLDASFIPKIADFGMAKFLGRDFSKVLTTVRGTIGYLAPEWISGVAITTKVDVYSYGMMLIEMISGKRNSSCNGNTSDEVEYFPVEVASKLAIGDVGSLLDAERVCKVACWCIQDNESNRPTMGVVVQILEGLLEIDMPPMPRLLQAIVGISP
ncbi:hypothetical protein PVAP13_3KG135800 [Panicum virgatum]|uniref:Receptor-like serine/threonine-protein kinase n=1 Tax=Panicum virgatum TaxID=38727 RepID=A0A8T0UQX9_PANVG|nr:hypothetical protein PVAP13_3KG135800 [Panicum virgatum]